MFDEETFQSLLISSSKDSESPHTEYKATEIIFFFGPELFNQSFVTKTVKL